MSVVDYLLNSLIKRLQKIQKARKKRKTKKRRAAKARRKLKRSVSIKKPLKRKQVKRAKRSPGRPAKRILKKPSKPKKKKAIPRKALKRSKAKPKKAKRAVKKVSKVKKVEDEIRIGTVTHFFSRIQVIVLKMDNGKLLVGDQIHILGRTTDFIQKVKSLQIESVDVKTAKKGQLVGLKVSKRAKPGDRVFKRAI